MIEATVKEQHDGVRWLLSAGAAAILIAGFVAWSDSTLSNSDREHRLGETLHELRSAQTTLPSGALDPRMGNTVVLREPAAPAILAAGKQASGGHAEKGDEKAHH